MERIVTERLHAGYSGWTKVVVRGDVRIIGLRFFPPVPFVKKRSLSETDYLTIASELQRNALRILPFNFNPRFLQRVSICTLCTVS